MRGRSFRWKALVAFNAVLPIGVGLDQARIDRKAFAADQPPLDTSAQDALEHAAKEVTLPEATMSVLRERRVIRDCAIQTKPAKPAIDQIKMNLITQASLRSEAEAVPDREHPDHQLGIDRRPPDASVERRQIPPDPFKVDEPVD